jgi:hypothetical protein
MRNDFCVFILTHGRPDRVHTYDTLLGAGYTGSVFILIDDEDSCASDYKSRFGEKVIQFCKAEVAAVSDEGDNFGHRKSTLYARNAMHQIASKLGFRYFIQLDDDYTSFQIRHNSRLEYGYWILKASADDFFSALLEFYIGTPCVSVATSQGGDHIGGGGDPILGGGQGSPSLRRKCMNSFICSVERPLQFFGHLNEDVNMYVTRTRKGDLFFTVIQAMLVQKQTQSNPGGMSDIYLDSGTYVKSFYTVMYAPSCVSVGTMGDPRGGRVRIHHKINWHNTAPKILREEWCGASRAAQKSREQSQSSPELCHPLESSSAPLPPSQSCAAQPSKRKGEGSKPQL